MGLVQEKVKQLPFLMLRQAVLVVRDHRVCQVGLRIFSAKAWPPALQPERDHLRTSGRMEKCPSPVVAMPPSASWMVSRIVAIGCTVQYHSRSALRISTHYYPSPLTILLETLLAHICVPHDWLGRKGHCSTTWGKKQGMVYAAYVPTVNDTTGDRDDHDKGERAKDAVPEGGATPKRRNVVHVRGHRTLTAAQGDGRKGRDGFRARSPCGSASYRPSALKGAASEHGSTKTKVEDVRRASFHDGVRESELSLSCYHLRSTITYYTTHFSDAEALGSFTLVSDKH
jgi:hypothetical protein